MKTSLVRLTILVSTSPVGRLVYRLCRHGRNAFLRMGSAAKQAALFPDAQDLLLDLRADIKYPQNIQLGQHIIIGADCQLGAMAPIKLGHHVRLSRGVIIETAGLDTSHPPPYRHTGKPIVIGDGAWLGAYAVVLGGVTIGEHAVIGAGTIVSKDVPPHAMVVGAPSRLLGLGKTEAGA